MNRTQRLLELVYFLMNAPRPVTLAEIREAFTDYAAENEESSRRKFERDKETLRQLGIAIEVVRDEEAEVPAYRIDTEETFLPAIEFEDDEVLALALQARVSRHIEHFPLIRQTEEALRKILYDRQEGLDEEGGAGLFVRLPDEAANPDLAEWNARIYRAIERHKTLSTRYHTLWSDKVADRDIDPYGLFYKAGHWTLIGWCHLRKAERTFLVERFRDIRINAKNPGTPDYEIPPDLDLRKARLRPPWLWEGGGSEEVEIAFTGKVAWQVEKTCRAFGQFESLGDGGGLLTVIASNPGALIDWVLSFGPEAVIRRPAHLARRLVSKIEKMRARHEAPGGH
ncbi:MAG: helix-turn-helix transcriptional regulator [Myxococcota bacterium]